MSEGIALLAALGAAIVAWHWTGAARERVDAISRTVCEELGLQRLDQAIALRAVRLRRTARGIRVERVFGFEFSTNGADRRAAEVCLEGQNAVWVHLDHPDGAMHIDLSVQA